jgi:ribosome-binding protein aMBF1 (putative translation factor)
MKARVGWLGSGGLGILEHGRRVPARREAVNMLADVLMPIADRLKAARKAVGMTQQDLAVKAGLSISAVVHIEAGRIPDPRVSTLRALAKALGLSMDVLAAEDEPEAPPAESEQPKKPRGKKK